MSQGAASPPGGSPGSEESEEERKRQERMQRNRESAQQSRARKRMQLDELERRNGELQAHNTHLSGAQLLCLFGCVVLRHESISWRVEALSLLSLWSALCQVLDFGKHQEDALINVLCLERAGMVAALSAENAALRHQLAVVHGQAPQQAKPQAQAATPSMPQGTAPPMQPVPQGAAPPVLQRPGMAPVPMPMPGLMPPPGMAPGMLLPPGMPAPQTGMMPFMAWMPGIPFFGPTPKVRLCSMTTSHDPCAHSNLSFRCIRPVLQ